MQTTNTKAMLLVATAVLTGCSPEEKSPAVQKLEASELHQLGTSCSGIFFSFDGENLVEIKNGRSEVVQKDVVFADIGDGRIVMTAKYGSYSMVSRFHLNREETVLSFDSFNFDPKPTAELLEKAGLPLDYEENMDRNLRKVFPPLVLCPKTAT